MSAVVNSLATQVPTAVATNVETALPLVLAAFGIGLTFYIIRKVLKGGAKTKFKI